MSYSLIFHFSSRKILIYPHFPSQNAGSHGRRPVPLSLQATEHLLHKERLLTYAKKVTVSVLYWYARSFRYIRQSLDTTPKGVDFFFPRCLVSRQVLESPPTQARRCRMTVWRRSWVHTFGYGHTWLKAPHPVRFVKLSNHRLN